MLWKFPPEPGLVWLFSDILDLLPIERSNPCNFRRWFCLARIRNVVFTRSVSLYGSRRKILRSVKISIDRIHSQSASIRGGSPNGKIVENSLHSLYIETELADGCTASTIQSYRKLSLLQIWRKIQNETGIRSLDRAVAESWKFKVEIREVREIWSLLSSLLATGLGPAETQHIHHLAKKVAAFFYRLLPCWCSFPYSDWTNTVKWGSQDSRQSATLNCLLSVLYCLVLEFK